MNTTSLFDPDQPLTTITKDRIQSFLPGLWDEVFKIATPLPSPTLPPEVFSIIKKPFFLSKNFFLYSILDYYSE